MNRKSYISACFAPSLPQTGKGEAPTLRRNYNSYTPLPAWGWVGERLLEFNNLQLMQYYGQ
jgi:hypothetical protein